MKGYQLRKALLNPALTNTKLLRLPSTTVCVSSETPRCLHHLICIIHSKPEYNYSSISLSVLQSKILVPEHKEKNSTLLSSAIARKILQSPLMEISLGVLVTKTRQKECSETVCTAHALLVCIKVWLLSKELESMATSHS